LDHRTHLGGLLPRLNQSELHCIRTGAGRTRLGRDRHRIHDAGLKGVGSKSIPPGPILLLVYGHGGGAAGMFDSDRYAGTPRRILGPPHGNVVKPRFGRRKPPGEGRPIPAPHRVDPVIARRPRHRPGPALRCRRSAIVNDDFIGRDIRHLLEPDCIGAGAHLGTVSRGYGYPAGSVKSVLTQAVPLPGILGLINGERGCLPFMFYGYRDAVAPGGQARPPHEHFIGAGRLGTHLPGVGCPISGPETVLAIGVRTARHRPGAHKGGTGVPIVDNDVRRGRHPGKGE
jgi:hypothetical protein